MNDRVLASPRSDQLSRTSPGAPRRGATLPLPRGIAGLRTPHTLLVSEGFGLSDYLRTSYMVIDREVIIMIG